MRCSCKPWFANTFRAVGNHRQGSLHCASVGGVPKTARAKRRSLNMHSKLPEVAGISFHTSRAATTSAPQIPPLCTLTNTSHGSGKKKPPGVLLSSTNKGSSTSMSQSVYALGLQPSPQKVVRPPNPTPTISSGGGWSPRDGPMSCDRPALQTRPGRAGREGHPTWIPWTGPVCHG